VGSQLQTRQLNIRKKIEVLAYDDEWPSVFQKEHLRLKECLKDIVDLEVYHIGSTAVPDLAAKPIVDILIVCSHPATILSRLKELCYSYKGEFNIPNRLFFEKKKSKKRAL